jgi:hypothetical protein
VVTRNSVLFALLGLVALVGCSTDVSPFTAASFKTLPAEGTRVLVWGQPQVAVTAAETWLQNRGLVVVDRTKTELQSCRDECPEESVLKMGRSARADHIVFLRASREQEPKQVIASIRSVRASNSEDLWQASAREAVPAEATEAEVSGELVKVVCHALATAWGFRGGGYERDPSLDFCHLKGLRP